VTLPLTLRIHAMVPVRVNGSEPLRFALDTGAPFPALVGRESTARLGLKPGLRVRLGGSGSGRDPYGHLVHGLTFSLGEMDLLDRTAAVMAWEMLPVFDSENEVHFDGILGYDLLKRAVVELDFERGELTLYEPSSFDYSGAGQTLPLLMHQRKPYADAGVVLEGGAVVPVRLHVDLGNRGSLSLIPRSHPDIRLPTNGVRSEGWGLSGSVMGVLGRVRTLQLGAHRLQNVVTKFHTSGYATAGNRNGVLGLEVLRRFRVIFDYARKRMILESTTATSTPFEADTSALDMESLLQRLRAGDGTAVEVCVRRAGEVVCVSLRLRRRV
jgi:hypothetical protein